MRQLGKTVIYTDLDGSFLDERTYSFLGSLSALRSAQECGVPVVFCSSKTRAEIERLRKAAVVTDPFIVEDGGAIYIPKDYFPFAVEGAIPRDDYEVVEFGEPYTKLVDCLRSLRGVFPTFDIEGFSDLTAWELALECGLTLYEAKCAKAREYSEPFLFWDHRQETVDLFLNGIKRSGMQYSTNGRYYHLRGNHDKGQAVKILTYLYRRAYGHVTTAGIGVGPNDASMLSGVALPGIIKQPCGAHHPELVKRFPRARITEEIGPRGWSNAVLHLLDRRAQAARHNGE